MDRGGSERAPPRTIGLLGLVAATALAAVGLLSVSAPRPAGADAPAGEFSAERALVDLEVIARERHPAASAAAERVRAHLVARLEALGLEVELQTWTPSRSWSDADRSERSPELSNVIARWPGSAAGARTFLFVCHYDAVPLAYGAGDDGAAVAAFLEAIRALRTGPEPLNELVFLFTDGEELGLLGAERFVQEHPLMGPGSRVAAVFNFEGRGIGGPALLFETGSNSGRLVTEYARCAPHPIGSSIGPAVYERMPNDTDFTPFRRAGLPGLNFAFIGGASAYHRPADRIENLELGTLQHHGTNVLALARHFGAMEPARADALGSEPDAVFLTLPGNLFLHHPGSWNPWLALAALTAVVAALARSIRAGALPAPGLALGALAAPVLALLCAASAAGVAWLGARGLALFMDRPAEPQGNLLSATVGLVALSPWLCGLATLLARRIGARRAASLAGGTVVLWSALAAMMSRSAPGALHAYAWPAAVGAAALAAGLARSAGARATGLLLLAAAAAPLLPIAALLHSVGTAYPSWVAALLGALVLAPLALFAAPWLERATRSAPRWTAPLMTALGAVLLLAAEFLARDGR